MARIYVSSTSEDLMQCRKAVLSALRRMRHEVIGMEDCTATDGPPLDECLKDVATCDVYIGLFAWRYGYIPDCDNPEKKSITELEFRKAQAIEIPCYIFLLDKKAAWPFHHQDQELNNILTLRDEFCKTKTVDFFTDENTLATKVSTTLTNWERSLVKDSITLEEHKTILEQRDKELREELSTEKNQNHIRQIELELSFTQEQLTNLDQSYQQALKRNEELACSLEELQEQHSDSRIEEALKSVKSGDHSKAKQFFSDMVENGEELNITFGVAAYQMGLIAEGEIKYEEALKSFQKAVNFQPENTFYLNKAGLINLKLAAFKESILYFEKALACDLESYGEDHPQIAICWNNLGSAWKALGEYQKAISYYELALTNGLKSYGEAHPQVATYRNNLGSAWELFGNYQKAIDYYEKALDSDLKTYGEDHPGVARDRNNLGGAWALLGQYEKAIDYLELAFTSDLKTFGENNPQVATYRNNLGEVCRFLGEYQKAIVYYELALASTLKTYGEDHPKVAIIYNNIGLARHSLDEYRKAIFYFELALASGLKSYGEAHPQVSIYRNNLGLAWNSLGNHYKAIEFYELALVNDLKTFGEAHPQEATYRNNLGSAWLSLGEYQKAIGYFEMALAILEKTLGETHPNTEGLRANLADAREKLAKVATKLT